MLKKHNPYTIVRMFEEELALYTGAPYAVAVDSCTSALFLCCKRWNVRHVIIPSRTYLSVPMTAMHAGAEVTFDTSEAANSWRGIYQLRPYRIWDAAKRLTSGMYIPHSLMCLSFHIKKPLAIGKGGAILCDHSEDAEWFRRARYEGRGQCAYKDDQISFAGWNMYMTPQEAAHGLCLLEQYPEQAEDQDEPGGYRELTELEVFRECGRC